MTHLSEVQTRREINWNESSRIFGACASVKQDWTRCRNKTGRENSGKLLGNRREYNVADLDAKIAKVESKLRRMNRKDSTTGDDGEVRDAAAGEPVIEAVAEKTPVVQASQVQVLPASEEDAPIVQASPVQSQSGQASPVQSQSGQASPVQSQSGQASPVQSQSGQASPVQSQSAQASPVQLLAKMEASHTDAQAEAEAVDRRSDGRIGCVAATNGGGSDGISTARRGDTDGRGRCRIPSQGTTRRRRRIREPSLALSHDRLTGHCRLAIVGERCATWPGGADHL